ncbi:MAG: linear amide C-N hydrolase [Candidatus Heimdallarchaeota archaeon]|nr:linear amide C-N hydrolase [Candidatus Heimdallarchaeota archaeon]
MNKKNLARLFLTIVIISIITISFVFTMLNLNNTSFTPTEEKTLNSLTKVDNYPLFIMTYYGNYGFTDYLNIGIENLKPGLQTHIMSTDNFSIIVSRRGWGCTCFTTLNPSAETMFFGRNFDWSTSPKLLLFTSPSNGYASYTMVDLEMLGFSSETAILNASPTKLRKLLNAPYWTLDGMNNQGLAVACMAVPIAENTIDPKKITLGSLEYMRLVLDYAKNVEEALVLWEQYNVNFAGGPPLHYLISDAEGNSAIVEFVGGEKKIIRNQYFWQISTNFIIYNSTVEEQDQCWRYSTAIKALNASNGIFSLEEAMNLLSTVAQINTQWSTVYDTHTGEVFIAMGRKYNQVHNYNLHQTRLTSQK